MQHSVFNRTKETDIEKKRKKTEHVLIIFASWLKHNNSSFKKSTQIPFGRFKSVIQDLRMNIIDHAPLNNWCHIFPT